jgi:hypothetical protein
MFIIWWFIFSILSRNKEAGKNKFKSDIDLENERLAKKLANVKGMYNFDKSVIFNYIDFETWLYLNIQINFIKLLSQMKDYEYHRSLLKISSKKFYTPRGMGHRKVVWNDFFGSSDF